MRGFFDTEKQNPEMCTIFTISMGKKVLFGNNEDNQRSPDETFIAFVPRQEIPNSWSTPGIEGSSVIHGFLLVGVIEGKKLFPQGGVNDRGLCYDINGLPPVRFNGQSGISWREWFNSFDILWHCSTVKDVENWYLTHQFSSQTWYGGQLHFADATGDAMVLGIGPSGEYVFTWKGDEHFLVSTNFNLANHENANGYPCSRFETATHMLRSIDEDTLTVEACADILDAVHIEYKDRNGTVYSNIFDLVKRKAYIYHLHDFDNVIEFDLDQELSQIKTNDTQFRMAGSNLFSKFQGVRIFVIEDLFTN
ncbi:MAG: carcinine hydrolase/isopenicillin-N N-acyltransferase family protein [Candidatus Thorarchaeota archaeon]